MDFYEAHKKDIKKILLVDTKGDQRMRLSKPRAAISRAISADQKRFFWKDLNQPVARLALNRQRYRS